jgi:hypothetical protein
MFDDEDDFYFDFFDEDDEYLESLSDSDLKNTLKFLSYIKYMKEIGKNVVIPNQKYAI